MIKINVKLWFLNWYVIRLQPNIKDCNYSTIIKWLGTKLKDVQKMRIMVQLIPDSFFMCAVVVVRALQFVKEVKCSRLFMRLDWNLDMNNLFKIQNKNCKYLFLYFIFGIFYFLFLHKTYTEFCKSGPCF